MMSNELIWKFFKFGVVGFTGLLVDFGITWLLKERLKLNAYLASSTGFTCAVINNFLLNRIWTFENHDPEVAVQFGKFAVVSAVGLVLNNSIIYLLKERFGFNFYVAKLVATAVVLLWNFWANMQFTFR
ncbi:MAG: GtrA family protein [Chitinophagales bacterium]|jgi:putative flippase GtrA